MSTRIERLGNLLSLVSRAIVDAIRRGESDRMRVLDDRYFKIEDALYDMLRAQERSVHFLPRTKRVHFVRASDPIGRMIILAAARMWPAMDYYPSGVWDDEYLRGQVHLIAECVRVVSVVGPSLSAGWSSRFDSVPYHMVLWNSHRTSGAIAPGRSSHHGYV